MGSGLSFFRVLLRSLSFLGLRGRFRLHNSDQKKSLKALFLILHYLVK